MVEIAVDKLVVKVLVDDGQGRERGKREKIVVETKLGWEVDFLSTLDLIFCSLKP